MAFYLVDSHKETSARQVPFQLKAYVNYFFLDILFIATVVSLRNYTKTDWYANINVIQTEISILGEIYKLVELWPFWVGINIIKTKLYCRWIPWMEIYDKCCTVLKMLKEWTTVFKVC